MLRFVFGYDNRHHVGPCDLLLLSWLSIRDRVSYFKMIHLFKIKHGLSPNYLRTNILSVSDMHSYNTRGSSSNFHVPKSLSNAPSAFAFSCVRLWNGLPERIKLINSLIPFKRELKRFLLSSYDWFLPSRPDWIIRLPNYGTLIYLILENLLRSWLFRGPCWKQVTWL